MGLVRDRGSSRVGGAVSVVPQVGGVDMTVIEFTARQELVQAALSYEASVLGDETSAHYDAELELKTEILNEAARKYVEAIS
jgi:hypothetical protein